MGQDSLENAFDLAERLLDRQVRLLVERIQFVPLLRAVTSNVSTTYLLRYGGLHGLYRLVPGRPLIVYIGSAQLPTQRIAEHASSLTSAVDLDVGDFDVGLIHVASADMSRYLEGRLIQLLDPPWNRREYAGFGSKPQGRVRQAGQRSSAWDQLHPGRPWAARK